jgi:hypothetical protein
LFTYYRRLWLRYQALIATTLLLIGAGGLFLFLAAMASGPAVGQPDSRQFAVDFRDYWLAAGRLAHGQSPYNPDMLSGLLSSFGLDRYRYPPVLAFLLLPLNGLSYVTAGALWDGLSLAAIFGGIILAIRAAAWRPGRLSAVWVMVGVLWFFPVWDSLWKGNVEGLQVLLIGFSLSAAASGRIFGVVANAWLKIAPVFLVPALLIRDRKKGFWGLLLVSGLLVLPSFLLAPAGYWQLPQILINISGGDATVFNNMAPAAQVMYLTHWAAAADLIRGLTILAALGLVWLSCRAATKPTGWPAAVACGTAAGLLFPATIWFHYLVLLLPLVAIAWPRLRGWRASVTVAAMFATSLVSNLPLVSLGLGALVFALVIWVLWPRESPEERIPDDRAEQKLFLA